MKKWTRQQTARIQIITAMLTFGTLGLFIKRIPLASSEIALYRGIIALLILSFILGIKNGRPFGQIKKSQFIRLFFSGAAIGFNWILLFEAYRYTSIALSTLSYYFAPAIVIIASAVLFHEKLTFRQLFCFLASSFGLILIIGVSEGGKNDLTGILFGLGAAFFYALVVLFNKSMTQIDGLSRTAYQFAGTVLVLFPYVAFTNGFHLKSLSPSSAACLLTVGVFHTGLMYFLYFSSLSHLKGQQAAILSYLDPLTAVFVSVLFLKETITPAQLAGGVIIILFAAANEITWHPSRTHKA